ncbi:Uncharacterised protein [Salmonella enterica subsp. enterica serovar Bovismorbificans]|uniref:Uncharacterized protein n=1 Tax=Salmonella enterica subsp. enterica serovar Bovismorbificans TaxID=58097 RepID=A0A655BNW4_SALET|nr:Uncharacterised protein [Salmonella enterica subsp. enterica serovar Bovismorbificans]CNU44452.1 Uncharacterised protein [Salmonella enterica subsp. enterica serovar Bovismorbificans]CNU47476.1 Uncharacterised protein [Salmonella enterica subsp. enterica serovar Bovismorbificans]CPR53889.1 Uncharacterised protein [Salmonella enterica subsp. enterica serovar Bovismorbificans]
MLRNLRFVFKDQVQRPDGDAEHDRHVRHRANLNIHLVGNNRNGNN